MNIGLLELRAKWNKFSITRTIEGGPFKATVQSRPVT